MKGGWTVAMVDLEQNWDRVDHHEPQRDVAMLFNVLIMPSFSPHGASDLRDVAAYLYIQHSQTDTPI